MTMTDADLSITQEDEGFLNEEERRALSAAHLLDPPGADVAAWWARKLIRERARTREATEVACRAAAIVADQRSLESTLAAYRARQERALALLERAQKALELCRTHAPGWAHNAIEADRAIDLLLDEINDRP